MTDDPDSDAGGSTPAAADSTDDGPADAPDGPVRTSDAVARRLPSTATAAVLVAAGVAGVAGSYAVAGSTAGYVVSPVESVLTRYSPSVVVTFAITVLGDLGKRLNVATATALSAAGFAGVAAAGVRAARRVDRPALTPVVAGALATALAWLPTGAPAAALGAGAGVALTLAAAELPVLARPSRSSVAEGRRRIIGGLASAAGVGVVGSLLGRQATRRATQIPDLGDADAGLDDPQIDRLLAEADRKSLDVAGIEPLVSSDFYEVDINLVDNPVVDRENWTLSVTGAVDTEVEVDYEELLAAGTEHRFMTLRCVGESLNGHKMDTALWTGVPIERVVDAAGPQGNYVVLRAVDDYDEEFPVEALEGGMLAWGMNGKPLPRAHGYPVRALIPGHWGEINVKWITEIEISEEPHKGYWERRGWHGTGPANTVAKIHDVTRREGRVQVAGHAYAGDRGVSAVEVSTDGGDSWTEATLSDPLPGEDVWRQWRHEYDHPGESHEVVARAVESDGTVQPRERSEAFPSGPTGWVSRTVDG